MTPDQPNPRQATLQPAADLREGEEFAELTRALQAALTSRQPRAAFADELRAQLSGESKGVTSRLRGFLPSLQFAAVLALSAGFLLLMLRRLTGSDNGSDLAEDALPSSA